MPKGNPGGTPGNLRPKKKGAPAWNKGMKGKPTGKISSKNLIQYWLDMETTGAHPNDPRRKIPESDKVPMTWYDKTIISMIKQAAKGNTFAFNALLDRLEGKPSTTMRLESEEIKSVTFKIKKYHDPDGEKKDADKKEK